jgi:hypothetical protein
MKKAVAVGGMPWSSVIQDMGQSRVGVLPYANSTAIDKKVSPKRGHWRDYSSRQNKENHPPRSEYDELQKVEHPEVAGCGLGDFDGYSCPLVAEQQNLAAMYCTCIASPTYWL